MTQAAMARPAAIAAMAAMAIHPSPGKRNITSGVSDHNSWNGFTVSASDFQSLDASQAMATRNADGTLPVMTLFRLNTGSSMMDAGVDVGLPYSGSAPDLGAFEDGL